MPAQFGGSPQVNLLPEHFTQFDFQAGHSEQSRDAPRLEFDKYIDVTLRPEIIAQNGAVKRKLSDMIFSAKFFDFFFWNVDIVVDHSAPTLTIKIAYLQLFH